MAGKRMLIVSARLIKKSCDNRGKMSQGEFIDFLIESQLKEETTTEKKYVTKEEIRAFEQDMKRLFKSFLDFFVGYGLEMGKQSPRVEFEELASKLKELDGNTDSGGSGKEATIKWKEYLNIRAFSFPKAAKPSSFLKKRRVFYLPQAR